MLLVAGAMPLAGLVSAGVLVATTAPAGATVATVGDEASFRTAFADTNVTSITLSADVHLTGGIVGCDPDGSPAVRSSTTDLTIDGAGHTIFQDCPEIPNLFLGDTGGLSLGNVHLEQGAVGIDDEGGGSVTLTNSSIADVASVESPAGILVFSPPDSSNAVTLTNSSIVGVTGLDGSASGGIVVESAGSTTVSLTSSTIGNITTTGTSCGCSTVLTVGIFGFQFGSDPLTVSLTNSTIQNVTGTQLASGVLTLTDPSEVVALNASTITGVPGDSALSSALRVFGDLSLVNSTISGNVAGIYVEADAAVAYSDIVDNGPVVPLCGCELGPVSISARLSAAGLSIPAFHATHVRAAGSENAQLDIDNLAAFGSVVALPRDDADDCFVNTATTSTSYDFSSDATCGFTGVGDTQNGGDPKLGPLANNGGPTLTRQPQAGSPLIGKIPPGTTVPFSVSVTSAAAGAAPGTAASVHSAATATVLFDQRGFARSTTSYGAIGSVSVDPPTPPLVARFTG